MNPETPLSPGQFQRLDGLIIYDWKNAVIEAYKPLESSDGWLPCPNCREVPRVWVFDNGNHAKCRCGYKYEGGVSAESIIDAVHERKVPYDEWKDYLRISWNARCLPNAKITGPTTGPAPEHGVAGSGENPC